MFVDWFYGHDPNVRYDYFRTNNFLSDFLTIIRAQNSSIESKYDKQLLLGQCYRCVLHYLTLCKTYMLNPLKVSFSALHDIINISDLFYSLREKQRLKDAIELSDRTGIDFTGILVSPTEASIKAFVDSNPKLVHVYQSTLQENLKKAIKHREINDMNIKFVKPL